MRGYNNHIFSFFLSSPIFFSLSLLILCIAAEHDDGTAFSYMEASGRGPSKWGELDPKWRACGNGKLQSPIDLNDQQVKVTPALAQLKLDYKPANATIKSRGRDILVSWKGDAGKATINGTDYNLKHFHWHTSSEHSLNGTRHDLELHIVHESSNGELAVIGIIYQFGNPDPLLATLLPHIKSVTRNETSLGVLEPEKLEARTKMYYRYIGSLTCPPCTEGVVWTVMKEIRTVSKEQVQALKDAVDEGFQENARPIQASNGRISYLFKPWDITKLN